MNKVLLVGRLTRDPELRTLPSGKAVANFVVATNEFRAAGPPNEPSTTTSSPGTGWRRSAASSCRRVS